MFNFLRLFRGGQNNQQTEEQSSGESINFTSEDLNEFSSSKEYLTVHNIMKKLTLPQDYEERKNELDQSQSQESLLPRRNKQKVDITPEDEIQSQRLLEQERRVKRVFLTLEEQKNLGKEKVEQIMKEQELLIRNRSDLKSPKAASEQNLAPHSSGPMAASPRLIQPEMNPPVNKEKLDYKEKEQIDRSPNQNQLIVEDKLVIKDHVSQEMRVVSDLDSNRSNNCKFDSVPGMSQAQLSIDSVEGFGEGSLQSLQASEEVKMGHLKESEDNFKVNSFNDIAHSHSNYIAPNGYFVSDTSSPLQIQKRKLKGISKSNNLSPQSLKRYPNGKFQNLMSVDQQMEEVKEENEQEQKDKRQQLIQEEHKSSRQNDEMRIIAGSSYDIASGQLGMQEKLLSLESLKIQNESKEPTIQNPSIMVDSLKSDSMKVESIKSKCNSMEINSNQVGSDFNESFDQDAYIQEMQSDQEEVKADPKISIQSASSYQKNSSDNQQPQECSIRMNELSKLSMRHDNQSAMSSQQKASSKIQSKEIYFFPSADEILVKSVKTISEGEFQLASSRNELQLAFPIAPVLRSSRSVKNQNNAQLEIKASNRHKSKKNKLYRLRSSGQISRPSLELDSSKPVKPLVKVNLNKRIFMNEKRPPSDSSSESSYESEDDDESEGISVSQVSPRGSMWEGMGLVQQIQTPQQPQEEFKSPQPQDQQDDEFFNLKKDMKNVANVVGDGNVIEIKQAPKIKSLWDDDDDEIPPGAPGPGQPGGIRKTQSQTTKTAGPMNLEFGKLRGIGIIENKPAEKTKEQLLKEQIAAQPKREKHKRRVRRPSLNMSGNLADKGNIFDDYMDEKSSSANSGTSSKAVSVAYDEKPEGTKSRAKSRKKSSIFNPVNQMMRKSSLKIQKRDSIKVSPLDTSAYLDPNVHNEVIDEAEEGSHDRTYTKISVIKESNSESASHNTPNDVSKRMSNDFTSEVALTIISQSKSNMTRGTKKSKRSNFGGVNKKISRQVQSGIHESKQGTLSSKNHSSHGPGSIIRQVTPLTESKKSRTSSDDKKNSQKAEQDIKKRISSSTAPKVSEQVAPKKELSENQKRQIRYILFEDKEIFENSKIGLGQTRLETAVRKLKLASVKPPFTLTTENSQLDSIPPQQLVTYVEADGRKFWKKSGVALALSQDKRCLLVKSTTQSQKKAVKKMQKQEQKQSGWQNFVEKTCNCFSRQKKSLKVDKQISLKGILGFFIGSSSYTFQCLMHKDKMHQTNVEQWQYITLIDNFFSTHDFIFTDRNFAIDFLLCVQRGMGKSKKFQFVLNPNLIAIHMTKHKLRKIAQNQNVSLSQLIILGILKTIFNDNQKQGNKIMHSYSKYKNLKHVLSIAKLLKIRSKHLVKYKEMSQQLKKFVEVQRERIGGQFSVNNNNIGDLTVVNEDEFSLSEDVSSKNSQKVLNTDRSRKPKEMKLFEQINEMSQTKKQSGAFDLNSNSLVPPRQKLSHQLSSPGFKNSQNLLSITDTQSHTSIPDNKINSGNLQMIVSETKAHLENFKKSKERKDSIKSQTSQQFKEKTQNLTKRLLELKRHDLNKLYFKGLRYFIFQKRRIMTSDDDKKLLSKIKKMLIDHHFVKLDRIFKQRNYYHQLEHLKLLEKRYKSACFTDVDDPYNLFHEDLQHIMDCKKDNKPINQVIKRDPKQQLEKRRESMRKHQMRFNTSMQNTVFQVEEVSSQFIEQESQVQLLENKIEEQQTQREDDSVQVIEPSKVKQRPHEISEIKQSGEILQNLTKNVQKPEIAKKQEFIQFNNMQSKEPEPKTPKSTYFAFTPVGQNNHSSVFEKNYQPVFGQSSKSVKEQNNSQFNHTSVFGQIQRPQLKEEEKKIEPKPVAQLPKQKFEIPQGGQFINFSAQNQQPQEKSNFGLPLGKTSITFGSSEPKQPTQNSVFGSSSVFGQKPEVKNVQDQPKNQVTNMKLSEEKPQTNMVQPQDSALNKWAVNFTQPKVEPEQKKHEEVKSNFGLPVGKTSIMFGSNQPSSPSPVRSVFGAAPQNKVFDQKVSNPDQKNDTPPSVFGSVFNQKKFEQDTENKPTAKVSDTKSGLPPKITFIKF